MFIQVLMYRDIVYFMKLYSNLFPYYYLRHFFIMRIITYKVMHIIYHDVNGYRKITNVLQSKPNIWLDEKEHVRNSTYCYILSDIRTMYYIP